MTISSFGFIAMSLVATSAAIAAGNHDNIEFGRSALPVTLKRRLESDLVVHNKVRRNYDNAPQSIKLDIDELEFSDELDRELRLQDIMSMSMSFTDFPDTPSSPTVPSQSSPSSPSSSSGGTSPSSNGGDQNPTAAQGPSATSPTVLDPSSPTTSSPSFETAPSSSPANLNPSATGTPTFSGSASTTGDALTPTVAPNVGPIPAVAPTTVFDISEETNGVVIVEPPHGNTTVVRLEIRYLVETVLDETESFEADLDWMIFQTAVVASLGGNNSGVLDEVTPPARRLIESDSTVESHPRQLLSSSSFLRSCNSTIDSCYIMEADIVYILNGDRNTDMAAYLAYLALSTEMGSFDEDLDNVSRVEYIGPQPKLPPVAVDNLETGPSGTLTSRRTNSPRPFVAGASAAACVSGLLAIAVWQIKKRKQDRHHHLLEDVSVDQTSATPRESAQIVVPV